MQGLGGVVSRPESNELPAVGTVLVDKARSAIGEFRGTVGGRYSLRPRGGGREWDVDPKWVREATEEDLKADWLTGRSVASWVEKTEKR
ncbi:hypothetical protein QQM39_40100 [Streptomyces sp. DT2A-34]|nr:hypothetical protein [Streptomyces sp. DT2A-34]MDO0916795.1 hypothetical protein [Streptomyces sp. DT2A-34]